MKHYKEIEVYSTGQVLARVFCEDGRRCAYKFFEKTPFISKDTPEKLEKRCKEAHEWADKVVAICDKYEIKVGEQ